MAVKVRFVVLCWAAVPLLLNLAVVGTLLGVPCPYLVPINATCDVEEIQCAKLEGYNENKECEERRARVNSEEGLFACDRDDDSPTECVVDPDNAADCYLEWNCIDTGLTCIRDPDNVPGTLKPVNITKTKTCPVP